MQQCWNLKAEQRPEFSAIITALDKILTTFAAAEAELNNNPINNKTITKQSSYISTNCSSFHHYALTPSTPRITGMSLLFHLIIYVLMHI
jgi:hypothetical protein